MAEYIEREAVLEMLKQECSPMVFAYLADLVNDIPAADVREVVLCRDCIHYKPQQKSARWSSTTPYCSRSATIKMPPDGFCSFGVKTEES